MARTTHVKKARKDQGQCSKCGDEIKAGDEEAGDKALEASGELEL